MGAEWSDDSFYKKEINRWNAPKREGGMNRNGFERFPMMLYHTQEHPISHRHEVAIAEDVISLDKTRVILDAQAFNSSCQMTVNNEEELERAKRDGWCESQAEAVAWREQWVARLATEAAHRNYDDRNMSDKAKAEAEKAELAIPGHVAEIPERPRRKPGPKPKSQTAAE
jgi:hypothetical protein